MPELPEVEVVRRGLDPYVAGREIKNIRVLHPRANRGQEQPLEELLVGSTISGTARRGKYLWLELAGQAAEDPHRPVVFIHLGMSGQIRIGHTDSAHIRLQASLSGGIELSFIDQRTFGRWLYAPLSSISHIARDPLEPEFDAAATARRIRSKKAPIKAVLLDQTVVSGIGNIYADEALWAAGIRPTKKAAALLQRDAVALVNHAQNVMAQALEVGGTSFDSLYVNVEGESGYFARSLNAYGRTGQPCRSCDGTIQRVVLAGRSTHYCPQCQTF